MRAVGNGHGASVFQVVQHEPPTASILRFLQRRIKDGIEQKVAVYAFQPDLIRLGLNENRGCTGRRVITADRLFRIQFAFENEPSF